MQGLGRALRERAAALGLSDSEVARRTGLSQARYHNYVAETAEPDLGTLVRICRTLATSPDCMLDFSGSSAVKTEDDMLMDRLVSAASALEGAALAYTADLVEAMVSVQRKQLKAMAGAGMETGSRVTASSTGEPFQGGSRAVSGKPRVARKK